MLLSHRLLVLCNCVVEIILLNTILLIKYKKILFTDSNSDAEMENFRLEFRPLGYIYF